MTNKHITKTFTRQLDQADCGVACLLSVLRYHNGDISRERLRILSGTSVTGTTLLGLRQAAESLGFAAEGLQAEGVHNLAELTMPTILHVVIDERLNHYVVFYPQNPTPSPSPVGREENRFLIGEPGRGVIEMTADELAAIWQSKALLSLEPTPDFITTSAQRKSQLAWLRALVHDDLPLLGVAAALGVAVAGLGISMALFSQRLIDEILPKHDTQRLTLGLLLLGVLLLARAVINYLRGFFLLRQSRAFNVRIAGSFFSDLLRLPKSFFDSRKTGDIVARLNDTRRIQDSLNFLVGSVVIDVLVVLITAVFLFTYSWQIGLLTLLSFPLFGWLVWRFNGRIIAGQRDVMASYAQAESNFVDSVSGIGAIKAARQETFFARITQTVYGQFQQKLYDLGLLGNRYALLSEVFGVALLMGLIGITAFAVLQKQLPLGQMMAVVSMASSLIGAVAKLSTTNIVLQEARVAFDRMREFTELVPEDVPATNAPGFDLPAGFMQNLTVENLSFRFAGRPALLKNVSFSVSRGEIVGIIGETGSGKSMLLQLLQQFYQPESGHIFVNTSDSGIDFAGGGYFAFIVDFYRRLAQPDRYGAATRQDF